jgi:hypothetical protein
MTKTKTQAYYAAEFIAVVKCFIVQAPGLKQETLEAYLVLK